MPGLTKQFPQTKKKYNKTRHKDVFVRYVSVLLYIFHNELALLKYHTVQGFVSLFPAHSQIGTVVIHYFLF